MYTKAAIAAAFAGLTTAAPAARSSSQFTVIALASTTPIHFSTINASGRYFYIGRPASTYCPEASSIDCSQFSSAITVLSAQPNVESGMSLSVAVPGGQQVFVDSQGALSYTGPHSAYMGEGSEAFPFEYTPQPNGNTVVFVEFNNNVWYACPTGVEGEYQIFTAAKPETSSECIRMNMGTSAYTGAVAWEYT